MTTEKDLRGPKKSRIFKIKYFENQNPKTMKKNRRKLIFAIVRHVLTFFGGALVASDIDPGIADQLTGSALGIVSAVASLVEKSNQSE